MSRLLVFTNIRAELRAIATTDLWLDKTTSFADGFVTLEEFNAKQLELDGIAQGYGVPNSAILDGWGKPIRTRAASDLCFAIISSDGPNRVYEYGLGDDRSRLVRGQKCDEKLRDLIWDFNGSRRKLDHLKCSNTLELQEVEAIDP